MYIRQWLLGAVAIGAIALTTACSDTRRAENTPATAADRVDRDWTVERDEYVANRERELDDVDRRWDNFKERASAKSKSAWNEVKEESAGLRRELGELRNASRENWEEAKNRIDAGWERFEAKVRDVFNGNPDVDRPNR